jgi:hypothetical protein
LAVAVAFRAAEVAVHRHGDNATIAATARIQDGAMPRFGTPSFCASRLDQMALSTRHADSFYEMIMDVNLDASCNCVIHAVPFP